MNKFKFRFWVNNQITKSWDDVPREILMNRRLEWGPFDLILEFHTSGTVS